MSQIYELARRDARVLFVGSDLGAETLREFRKEMPERFFMEGVQEAHLVGMMAGLAMNGKIPYFNTIATFATRRCFEQILLDVGLHRLNVRIVGSGGGVVYAPLGPTHLAVDDLALMRVVPNLTVIAPCDAEELVRLMPQTLDYPGPIYLRLAKGGDPVVSRADLPCRIGSAVPIARGRDGYFLTTGITARLALEASRALEEKGVSVGVLHFHTVKPFDARTLIEAASGVRSLVSIEEHSVIGGLGSAAAEVLAEAGFESPKKFARLGLPDQFIHNYGSQESLMKRFGITASRAEAVMRELLSA